MRDALLAYMIIGEAMLLVMAFTSPWPQLEAMPKSGAASFALVLSICLWCLFWPLFFVNLVVKKNV